MNYSINILLSFTSNKPWPTVATSFRLLHVHGDVTPARLETRALLEFSRKRLSLQGVEN